MTASKTIVGQIDDEVLAFTVGKDPELDGVLLDADCLGTAAHVTMLRDLALPKPIFSQEERDRVVAALTEVMRRGRAGEFRIRREDQDVHMAVERILTDRLGDLGRRIHTGRSRNDQVAVDLRLFAKEELLSLLDEMGVLGDELLRFARRHERWPMVGRTHLQPAMPSSVGVWASAYAESLLDDSMVVRNAYAVNDRCPLGSAAGYGVPLAIDRHLTSRLLDFEAPIQNVMHASNMRGKCESVILAALSQVMLTLSRFAADLILYSMPEFGYFRLPAALCTGSSIMPQKKNPDVLELVRARAARVLADTSAVTGLLHGLPGGYNRDLQEAKEPFLNGIQGTRSSVRILAHLVAALEADEKKLLDGFSPAVFATDRALELVCGGMPFRRAYDEVREHLADLKTEDAAQAIARKAHYGAPGGLDWDQLDARSREVKKFATERRARYYAAMTDLLGVSYPDVL